RMVLWTGVFGFAMSQPFQTPKRMMGNRRAGPPLQSSANARREVQNRDERLAIPDLHKRGLPSYRPAAVVRRTRPRLRRAAPMARRTLRSGFVATAGRPGRQG